MKRKLEIIFQHGWGFDASSFSGWLTHVTQGTEHEAVTKVLDRGYFGKKKLDAEFTESGASKVLVCHSLGLHLVSESLIANADLVVSVGGFPSFHFGDTLSQRRSKRTLRLMREKLDHDPLAVLDDFYSLCYSPLATRHVLVGRKPSHLNVEELRADLDLLDKHTLAPQVLAQAGQLLILHGSQDAVVAKEQAYELNMTVPGSHLIVFEGAGHALPLTHVAPCWLSVHNSLNSIAPIRL